MDDFAYNNNTKGRYVCGNQKDDDLLLRVFSRFDFAFDDVTH